MSRFRRLLGAFLIFAACRAVETPYEYPDDLDHPNYVKRAMAVRDFAARRDEERLPEAFRLLHDDDAGIRNLAWQTLKSMMPEERDFGYRPFDPRDVREGAATRWEAWWRKAEGGKADRG